jgi:hypothetical protein
MIFGMYFKSILQTNNDETRGNHGGEEIDTGGSHTLFFEVLSTGQFSLDPVLIVCLI